MSINEITVLDELQHGPEMFQELRQRNEQFLHTMTAAEMGQLEQDFRQKRFEPIPE